MGDIIKESQDFVGKVTEAVEKAGAKVASQVSDMTDGKAEKIANEAIQGAVDQAIEVLQIAGEKVREKDLDAERVTLQVGIGISDIAHLRITADVPSDRNIDRVDVDVS